MGKKLSNTISIAKQITQIGKPYLNNVILLFLVTHKDFEVIWKDFDRIGRPKLGVAICSAMDILNVLRNSYNVSRSDLYLTRMSILKNKNNIKNLKRLEELGNLFLEIEKFNDKEYNLLLSALELSLRVPYKIYDTRRYLYIVSFLRDNLTFSAIAAGAFLFWSLIKEILSFRDNKKNYCDIRKLDYLINKVKSEEFKANNAVDRKISLDRIEQLANI